MKFLSLMAACFALSSLPAAQAQTVIDRKDFESINVTPVLEYLEDSGRMQGVRDIAAATEGWKRCGNDYLNFGYTDSAYWFRFSLKNETTEPVDCLLEINYPLLKFIDLYERQGDEFALLRKTGNGYPFKLREFFDRHFVFRLNVPAGESCWYIRIYTNSPLKFKSTIFCLEDFIRHNNLTTPLYWLYYGVFCLMAVLALFMFIRLKKISYLFLSLYIQSLALINFYLNGFTYQYFWPGAVFLNDTIAFLIMTGVIVFLSLFVASVIGTFAGSMLIKRILVPLIISPGVVLGAIFVEAGTSVVYRAIFTAWVIASISILFFVAFWGVFHRDRPSRSILYSFAFFFAGIVVYAMMDFLIIPYSDLNEWSMQLGSVMMVIVVTLGLVNDMKKSRDDLAESEKRLSNILATTREGFIEVDSSLIIRDVNPALCSLLGYNREDVIGKIVTGFIKPDNREKVDFQAEIRRKGVSSSYDIDAVASDGTTIHLLVNASPIFNEAGNSAGATVMVADISELKKREDMIRQHRDELQAAYEEMEATNEELNASNEEYEAMNEELLETQSELMASEKRLTASVDEKELLLKEVHHRVKNNLQVITSLLHLQSEYIFDERDRELFVESENRVRTMAMVHQKIYQSHDLSKVDFGEYVSELADDLFHVYPINRELVNTEINASSIFLGVDLAIPCALIINEAVTNAIKHAFPAGRKGTISIGFIRRDDKLLSLTVMDDGVGCAPRHSDGKEGSLGMQLMKALAVQIKGVFEIRSDNGTVVSVVFPGNAQGAE